MKINENGVLLRVFIGESDKFEHKPLYEAIVQKVRELGLVGATVLRGVEGFGAHSVVHKSQLLEMSTGLPLVVEIVDTEENIQRILPSLEVMVREGMITMEYVVILLYRHDEAVDQQPTAQ
jgi:PII-like signaling protein